MFSRQRKRQQSGQEELTLTGSHISLPELETPPDPPAALKLKTRALVSVGGRERGRGGEREWRIGWGKHVWKRDRARGGGKEKGEKVEGEDGAE